MEYFDDFEYYDESDSMETDYDEGSDSMYIDNEDSYSSESNDEDDEYHSIAVEVRSEAELDNVHVELANKYKLASLETLCLRNIATNMPSYIQKYQRILQQKLHRKKLQEINGPFEDIPVIILNKILQEYEKTWGTSLEVREVIMTRNIQNFKLWGITNADKRLLFNIRTKFQDNLRQLTLLNSKLTLTVLNNLLKSLKNLNSLNLSGTKIKPKTMEVISNMKSLVDLNLTKTGVTRKGIDYLCNGKLPNLKRLILYGNLANKAAIKILIKIIESYPELEVFEHNGIDAALTLWYLDNPLGKLKLTSLNLETYDPEVGRDYFHLLNCCSDLKHLNVKDYTNNPIIEFKLNCNYENLININFTHILPWFSSKSITKVYLSDIFNLNITDILLKFPNINDLGLINCVLDCTPDNYKPEMIKNNE